MSNKRPRNDRNGKGGKKRKVGGEKITTQAYEQLNNIEGMSNVKLSKYLKALIPAEYNVCSGAESFLTAIFLVCHYKHFQNRQNADEADKRWAKALENEDPSGIQNQGKLNTILNPETGFKDAALSESTAEADWTKNKIQIKLKHEENAEPTSEAAGPTKKWTVMEHSVGDLFKHFAKAVKAAIPGFSADNSQHVKDATRLMNIIVVGLAAADQAKAALFLPASMSWKRPGIEGNGDAAYGKAGGFNNAPYLVYGHSTPKKLKRAMNQEFHGLATVWQTLWNISSLEHTAQKKKPTDPLFVAEKANSSFGALRRKLGDNIMSKLFDGRQITVSFSAGLQVIVTNAVTFDGKLKRIDMPHPVFWSLVTPELAQSLLDGDLVTFWNELSPKCHFDALGFGNVDFEQWVLLQLTGCVFSPIEFGPKTAPALKKRSEMDMTSGDGAAKKGSIKMSGWAPSFNTVRNKTQKVTLAGSSNGYQGRSQETAKTFFDRLVVQMDRKTDAKTAKEAIFSRFENMEKAYEAKEKHEVEYWGAKKAITKEAVSVRFNPTFYVDTYNSADTDVAATAIDRADLKKPAGYTGTEVKKTVAMETA